MRAPAVGRLLTSNTGIVAAVVAGAAKAAGSAAVVSFALDVAEVVARGSLLGAETLGVRGEDAIAEPELASVLAKNATAASASSGRSAATKSHENRLRREAARTRSVGSGR